jgi:hypothetical protein
MTDPEGFRLLPRRFTEYVAALAVAYEDEAAGIAYYEELANVHEGARRESMALFRDIEVLATRVLEPLVERNRAPVFRGPVLAERGRREVAVYRLLPWEELMRRMLRDHQAFVQELQQLVDMAPEADREVVQAVTDIEHAIVQFLERETEGHPDSTEAAREIHRRLESLLTP